MKRIVLILSIGIVLGSCKPKPSIETNKVDNTPKDTVIVVSDLNSDEPTPIPTLWSSEDIGLPVGVVVRKDYASASKVNEDMGDNYITVRKPNGVLKITSDVDVDVYLNVGIGDSITN